MKRFYKGNILYHLICDLAYVLLAGVYFSDLLLITDAEGELIGFNSDRIPLFAAILLCVYALFALYRALYIKLSGYELSENEIVCQKGVLFRKKSRLEYKKINAINKKQNLLQRILKIAVLTVDSGSANSSHRAEIMIIERADVADALMASLREIKDGAVPVRDFSVKTEEKNTPLNESLYNFTSAKKLLFSLINLISSLFVILALLGLFAICMAVILSLKLVGISALSEYLIYGIIFGAAATLGVSVITFAVSVIFSFVTYYGFRVSRSGDNIEISYGLLAKRENSFGYSKIRGVKITQGPIKRLFGFATINLEVIGYTADTSNGKESSEGIGVLVPFCKMSDAERILSEILPDFVPTERQTRAKGFFPFISWFLFFALAAIAVIFGVTLPVMSALSVSALAIKAVAAGLVFSALAVLLIYTVNAIFRYRNAAISLHGDRLTVYGGGLIRQISVFKAKNVIALEEYTTPMRKRRGISSYIIHIRTNSQTNEIKLGIHDRALIDELNSRLIY